MYDTDAWRNKISEQLKTARINAGLTVTEVAEALGKNKNTIYGYELGRILPTADVFLQIMILYGIDDFKIFALDNRELPFSEPQQVINSEAKEFIRLLDNADEQGKSAAKAVLQSFQRLEHPPQKDNVLKFLSN